MHLSCCNPPSVYLRFSIYYAARRLPQTLILNDLTLFWGQPFSTVPTLTSGTPSGYRMVVWAWDMCHHSYYLPFWPQQWAHFLCKIPSCQIVTVQNSELFKYLVVCIWFPSWQFTYQTALLGPPRCSGGPSCGRSPVEIASPARWLSCSCLSTVSALPVSSCGLRLDDEAVKVVVGLRLGLPLCTPRQFHYGALVDVYGTHGFVCDRTARHHGLNELIARASASVGIPTAKKPNGLTRGNAQTACLWSLGMEASPGAGMLLYLMYVTVSGRPGSKNLQCFRLW